MNGRKHHSLSIRRSCNNGKSKTIKGKAYTGYEQFSHHELQHLLGDLSPNNLQHNPKKRIVIHKKELNFKANQAI